jgi:hypothetical protein
LSLLIKNNPDIINYIFSINFIEENYKEISKIDNKNQLKKVLNSKIIIELIQNFKGIDNNDEDLEIANNIENENVKIIENNIIAFKDLNLFYNVDEIIEKPIDKIYTDIIISLIKDKKLEDFEYSYNILNPMEIEKIFLTETMFKELKDIFDLNEDYITDYSLTEKEDIFNEKNINFFYILLKYILKKSFFIYQINFLYQQRKFILKLYKLGELFNDIKDKINDKLEYVLRMMLDSDYYFKDQLEKLNEVLIYFKNFLFESKKKDIENIEDIIKNNKMGSSKYLEYYDTAKRMNIRKDIINYLFKLDNNNNEGKIEKSVFEWNTIEYMINEKRINEIDINIKDSLRNYFKDPNKEKELFNIFNQEAIIYFINNTVAIENISTNITTSLVGAKKKKRWKKNYMLLYQNQ